MTPRWYGAWPAQPRRKLALGLFEEGARTGWDWSLRPGSGAERRSLSGAQDHCLSADTVGSVCLPAEERDFPRGPECWVSGWGHTDPSHSKSAPRALGAQDGGWGWEGRHLSPEVRHLGLLLPGHRATGAPFSSGITLGQTGGPQGPSGRTNWDFARNPSPVFSLPASQECQGLSIRVYV